MAIRAEVNVSNFNTFLRAAISSSSETGRRKYLKNAAAVILRMEANIFKTQGTELGPKWKPLAQATIDMRKKRRNLKGKRARGMTPLHDTGMLRMSVSSGSAERGPRGSIRELSQVHVSVGSNLPYAPAHQFGLAKRAGFVKQKHRRGYTVWGRDVAGYEVKAHSYMLGGAVYAVGTHGYVRRGRAVTVRAHAVVRQARTVNVKAYTVGPYHVGTHAVAATNVRAHTKMLPEIPARPFVGWTNRGIETVLSEAYRHFIEGPDQRTR